VVGFKKSKQQDFARSVIRIL